MRGFVLTTMDFVLKMMNSVLNTMNSARNMRRYGKEPLRQVPLRAQRKEAQDSGASRRGGEWACWGWRVAQRAFIYIYITMYT